MRSPYTFLRQRQMKEEIKKQRRRGRIKSSRITSRIIKNDGVGSIELLDLNRSKRCMHVDERVNAH